MLRGEDVKVLVDYDLFDININGQTGIYIKTDENTKKLLIYFPINGEWGELKEEQVERTNPDVVPDKNKEFTSRIKLLAITFPTK